MQWNEWYLLFSAIAYFGGVALGIAVSTFRIVRRFRHFRLLDWVYELFVAWLFMAALWLGIRQGPIWDAELAGSPIELRSLVALVWAGGSIAGAWWVVRRSCRLERTEGQEEITTGMKAACRLGLGMLVRAQGQV